MLRKIGECNSIMEQARNVSPPPTQEVHGKGCFTSSCVESQESAAKLEADNPSLHIGGSTGDASFPYYIICYLALGYAVAESLGVSSAPPDEGIAFIDGCIHEFLCMFDFPGFIMDRWASLPLVPGLDLDVVEFC